MRIVVVWFLIVDEWLNASASIRDLSAMADRSNQVTCILPVVRSANSISFKNLIIEPVRLRRSLPVISFLWFCLLAVTKIVARYRNVDVVVLSADVFPLALPLLRLSWRKHPPVVVVREASPEVEVRITHKYYHPMLRYISLGLLSRFSDAIFAISPMHADQIVSKFNIIPSKVYVWPSSVDTILFDSQKHSEGRDRTLTELRMGKSFLLMYHGALGIERGLCELVEAIHIVRDKSEDVSLLLLGRGAIKAEQRLRELIRCFGLVGVVLLHAPVPYADVPRYIATADAGVVPLPDHAQWRYQTPTKLLEYIAMRKPVIVTDIAAHRWLVGNRRTAFFCGRGSPAEIAGAILRCIRARAKIEDTGVDETAAKFSPDAIADLVLQVFDGLMQR